MPDINELSEKWTFSRNLWVEMNRKAAEFGAVLIENWRKYFNMGPQDSLLEPIPPDPQRLANIIGPKITTDPKSHRIADWMSDQFDVDDAIAFSQERRRFNMGILMMVPARDASTPDLIPFFVEFINQSQDAYSIGLVALEKEFTVSTKDEASFVPFFDFVHELLKSRYPQSLEEMVAMFSGRDRQEGQVGFRPKFD